MKRAPEPLTLGELITAAYDLIGETNGVARMLSSNALARRIGRHIIVG